MPKKPRSADENWEFLGRDSGKDVWRKGKKGEQINPMPETSEDVKNQKKSWSRHIRSGQEFGPYLTCAKLYTFPMVCAYSQAA